jgi:hypothetical protein
MSDMSASAPPVAPWEIKAARLLLRLLEDRSAPVEPGLRALAATQPDSVVIDMRRRNNTFLNWLVFAAIVAAFLVAYFTEPPVLAWRIVMVLLVLAIILIGLVAGPRDDNDRRLPMAALIDERNKISLSRFQTALWTVLIISAFVVAAMHNIRVGQNANTALDIAVPTELWTLLGTSGASLVGASAP